MSDEETRAEERAGAGAPGADAPGRCKATAWTRRAGGRMPREMMSCCGFQGEQGKRPQSRTDGGDEREGK